MGQSALPVRAFRHQSGFAAAWTAFAHVAPALSPLGGKKLKLLMKRGGLRAGRAAARAAARATRSIVTQTSPLVTPEGG